MCIPVWVLNSQADDAGHSEGHGEAWAYQDIKLQAH